MSHKYNRLEDYLKTVAGTQYTCIVFTTDEKMEELRRGYAYNLRKLEWSTKAKDLEVFAKEFDQETLYVYTRIHKEKK